MSAAGKVPDEATVQERKRLHARYWRPDPLRVTRVPEVLKGEPEFRALEAERQAVRDAMARVRRHRSEIEQRNGATRAEHREAVKRAIEAGDPVPPQPDLEQMDGGDSLPDDSFWTEKFAAIEAAETATLVERGDEFRSRLGLAKAEERAVVARRRLEAAEDELRPLQEAADHIGRLLAREATQRAQDTEAKRRFAASSSSPSSDGRARQELLDAFHESQRPPRRDRVRDR